MWIKAGRLHTLIPRGTDRWKFLYHQRGAVEREFGRQKHEWGMLPLRVRRLAVRYNQHRPHWARSLRPPDRDETTPAAATDLTAARIRRRSVLGGLISEYEQAA